MTWNSLRNNMVSIYKRADVYKRQGSYSPFVKCAIDRSLSYVQPYFTIRNHEMPVSYTHLDVYKRQSLPSYL